QINVCSYWENSEILRNNFSRDGLVCGRDSFGGRRMRLLALTLAAAAAVAFAALQNPSAVAQSSDTQAGGKSQSTQGNAAGQQRGSKDSATRQSGSGGQSAGRSEKSQQSAQGKSERSQTTVGIGSGSNRAMVRSRVQTRLSVRERGASDVTIKGKRSRHIVALHDQPSAMVIKKKKKFVRYGARTRFVASEPEERALIIKKKRHPSIAIRGESSRTTFRTHVGGSNINARASVRTRATTSGSATTTKK